MDTLFNITALRDEMADKPKGQRLNQFFDGRTDKLTLSQLDNLESLIESHTSSVKEYISSCREGLLKQENLTEYEN